MEVLFSSSFFHFELGGGDVAEDLEGGMLQALKELKWGLDNKFIIIFTDAPAHGSDFHSNLTADITDDLDQEKFLNFNSEFGALRKKFK